MYNNLHNYKIFDKSQCINDEMNIYAMSGRVGPVVARSPTDREVRDSNPTLA